MDTKTVTINITIPFAGRLRREIIGAIREIQRTARLASDPSEDPTGEESPVKVTILDPHRLIPPAF